MDCNWDTPGANPARGPTLAVVSQAVKNYGFSAQDQVLIISKAQRIANDGFVMVWRDRIEALPGAVASNLRDMHYGQAGKFCSGPVARSKWTDKHYEPGLVYCGVQDCIVIFPTCGNAARVDYVWPARPEPEFRFYDKPEYDKTIVLNTVPEPSSLVLALLALALTRKKL